MTAESTRELHFVPILGTAGSLPVRSSLPVGGVTDLILDVSGYFE